MFLRDDILDQITDTVDGFTALSHITARRADRLKWSEEQILSLIANRLFSSHELCNYLQIDRERLGVSREYRHEAIYRVFPPTVHSGTRQSPTLRWIYNHCKDGRGIVTPRDVIDLLSRARQRQHDECESDADAETEWIIGRDALMYGAKEMSRHKKDTFLKAEFPHFWPKIEKFCRGKTEYSVSALESLFGQDAKSTIEILVSIGVLEQTVHKGEQTYKIPFLYREGLELTQGRTV